MVPPTTLERLRVFHAVATVGTIAGAARLLGYTPSAVSQHLSTLERETGAALVERSNRGVSLTAAGVVLTDHASDILDLVRGAVDAVGAATGSHTTPVTVAAFPTAITALLLPVRRRLDASTVLTVVDAESEVALDLLATRAVDAAVVDGDACDRDPHGDRLHRVPLRTEPMRLVVPSGRRVRTIADCASMPWVLGGPGSRLGDASREVCRAAGFTPEVIVETDDHHITFDVLRSAGAVSILPELALADPPDGVRVTRVELPFGRRIEFVTRATLGGDRTISALATLLGARSTD